MTKYPYPLDTMIEGLSNEEYHAVDGLSSTQFDLMRKSMACLASDNGRMIGAAA